MPNISKQLNLNRYTRYETDILIERILNFLASNDSRTNIYITKDTFSCMDFWMVERLFSGYLQLFIIFIHAKFLRLRY